MSFKAVLEADIKGFSSNIDKAISDVDKLEKSTLQKLSKVGDSFIGIGKKASILSAAMVAAGGKAFSMAADFQDALGATEQIFKDNSDTVQDWANNLDTSYGIAKKEALSYSNLMGSMLINIGNLTEKEASKQSAKLIELAGDLTAMYGGTTQDAVRALTGALKGNNTMLDNYGMAVNEALIKQKSLELGLISATSEMTLQAKQAATLALIWEQTGAAQGQAAREADGASGAMRAFRTEVANLSTELGEVLLPIITPVISKLSDLVGSLRALSPEMQSMIVGIAGVAAVAGPLLIVIGNILKALPLLKAGFVALTGPIGLVSGAIILLAANFEDVVRNVTTMWNTFTTGISSSVKALVSLVTLDFKGFWTNIKAMVGNGVKWIVGQVEFMGEKLEWVLRKLGLEEWANKVNAALGGINIDQAALEAALAANEMTGSAGAMQKVATSAVVAASSVDGLTDSMKELNAAQSFAPTSPDPGSVSNSVGGLNINPVITPTVDTSKIRSAMGDLAQGIQVLTIDLSSMLAASLTDIFGAVSEAIMTGDNAIEALGSALLGTMGGIMVQLGQQVIATGAAIEAVKLALTSLGGLGAIAAGAALIAIGSMFKAGARKIGNSMGSGGYSSAPSLRNTEPSYGPSEYRGAYMDEWSKSVEFKISGDALVGTLERANNKSSRIG